MTHSDTSRKNAGSAKTFYPLGKPHQFNSLNVFLTCIYIVTDLFCQIITVACTDPDAVDLTSDTYTIISGASGVFEIGSSSGAMTIATGGSTGKKMLHSNISFFLFLPKNMENLYYI